MSNLSKEIQEKQESFRKYKCPHCGEYPIEQEPKEVIESIINCNNCRVDLQMQGNWTGTAHRSMIYLVEKHGLEYIKALYDQIKFEKV